MRPPESDHAITVYSDYVCPFCYLGKASLDRFLDVDDDPPSIEWHPYDLRAIKRGPEGEIDPTADDGKDDAYFEQVRENVRRLQDRYDVEMAREVATDVDSLAAQVASFYVQTERPDRWRAFDAAIFDALWVEERDIGDQEVLAEIAAAVGLDDEEVRQAATDDEWRAQVTERFAAARRRGITGVPTFVYSDHAARGAVPPEQFERLLSG